MTIKEINSLYNDSVTIGNIELKYNDERNKSNTTYSFIGFTLKDYEFTDRSYVISLYLGAYVNKEYSPYGGNSPVNFLEDIANKGKFINYFKDYCDEHVFDILRYISNKFKDEFKDCRKTLLKDRDQINELLTKMSKQ